MGQNYWVTGGFRSGKTQALVDFIRQWGEQQPAQPQGDSVLLFAMNAENRQQVTQSVLAATEGRVPLRSTTPLGFFEEEVKLFWPLIVAQSLHKASIPLRLRPEAEQYFAVQIWGAEPLRVLNAIEHFGTERWARNLLDVIQLAAFAGVSLEAAPTVLKSHWPVDAEAIPAELWAHVGQMVLQWQQWCLTRGLVTYGLVTDLYWRCLLPLPEYQAQLRQRYNLILADDVESYPAIARHLFEQCNELGIPGCYTTNPDFSIRLGLGADPDYLAGLKTSLHCKVQSLPNTTMGIEHIILPTLYQQNMSADIDLDSTVVESIETVTRSQLLRQTAETAIKLIKSGMAQPNEIAIIGPGLDSLARYALIDIIEAQDIPVTSLKEQRPLNASALVRSLLTVLMLIYDGLGRLINPDQVAEMMVVVSGLDPVRAGLITDHCFKPDIQAPMLLPLAQFPRWDRVGNAGAQAYLQLREWIEVKRSLRQELQPTNCLSQAIEYFWSRRSFRYDESAVLRELLETAQHFEAVGEQIQAKTQSMLQALIHVVQQGTMTANPYPVATKEGGIVLATAYQYRIARLSHRYHFWLDMSSPLWFQGSLIKLWQAEAFLSNQQRVDEDTAAIALFQDLSRRVSQKTMLCYSELSISGQEQMGSL